MKPCVLRWILLALAMVGVDLRTVHAAEPVRTNILFLLADDLGYGDVGCYGSREIETPNLDRLAATGLRLTSFYCPAPVCSPSRAGFLTGRTPNRYGIFDWIPANSGIYLPRTEITVAQLLKKAGYRTAHVGKWHLNSRWDGKEPTPGDHGFDHWFSTQNNAFPSHQNPNNFIRNGRPVGPLAGNSSTLIVDEAIRFLSAERPEPFLLFTWFHAPHEPIAVPPADAEHYQRIADATRREYYGCVTRMDREIGRLLAFLEEKHLAKNTLVIFASDNGPETLRRYRGAERSHGSPGPLRGMKLNLYEGGYRVPGIVVWPGKVKPGTTSDTPVCGTDLLPTLCDLSGIAPPADRPLDGISIRPLLEGKTLERSQPLYWQYDRATGGPWKVALRDGPWKLLADAKIEKLALYNLDNDIAEKNDLVTSEPDQVKRLSAILRRLYKDVNRPAGAKR